VIKNLGVGIDVVDIERFRKLPYKTNKSFYHKIFSRSEIRYCLKQKNSSQHFAGKFAIKEAVKKSLPIKIQMIGIVTSHKKSKPQIELDKQLPYNFLISVSHDARVAVAVVISQQISK
jgi:holo-[acyl-carrier protein] synthase